MHIRQIDNKRFILECWMNAFQFSQFDSLIWEITKRCFGTHCSRTNFTAYNDKLYAKMFLNTGNYMSKPSDINVAWYYYEYNPESKRWHPTKNPFEGLGTES